MTTTDMQIDVPKPISILEHKSQVEYLPLSDFLPYAKNARLHSDEQVQEIAASIAEYGFTNPVLIDAKNSVIAGHGRILAAEKLKLVHLPCIRLEHLTPEQVKAYRIADNALALRSKWDDEILKAEIRELRQIGARLDLLGFDAKELSVLDLPENEEKKPDDDYTKKIQAPIYEPKGEKPSLETLVDKSKTEALIAEIEKSSAPEEVKHFLSTAALRHSIFNYERIAEYYAHAPKEVQELMEKSALVIIDFDKAIENGFVQLSERLAQAYVE
jgi:hypothetical protein